ncbi:hypothetical protein [Agrobacterium tumefaciens]|uniref:hypothetical protein n=1 Tax=Agrobacterium tumefaciens TaxID=358 RepID=UPI001573D002|nr:hypothetical protein [Agrobacterium tumefaciens]
MKVKSRNPMPFYLVTQTSLVEADDEQAAAVKAIEQIRAGTETKVAVKADEATTTYVVVPARPVENREVPDEKEASENQPEPASVEVKAAGNTSLLKRIFSSAKAQPKKLR